MEFLYFVAFIIVALPLGLLFWAVSMNRRLRDLETVVKDLLGARPAKAQQKPKSPVVTQEEPPAPMEKDAPLPAAPAHVAPDLPEREKTPFNWEALFGGKAFVWVGALALAFAGFYLVKYSIEANLIGPRVRLALGFVFGLSLLVGADQVRKHPRLANGGPISQGLSGAGLVALYSVFFAATKLYDLLPLWAAFGGMAGVTLLAVILSMRFGMPIAVMGLLGGFLTPFFLDSNAPNALSLFIYLYLLVGGMAYLAFARGWTLLLGLIPVGAFLWVFAWRASDYFLPQDGVILGGFLVATALTNMALMLRTKDEVFTSLGGLKPSALTKAILIASFLMMASLMEGTFYSDIQWSLLWLLCAGSVAMAFFDEERFALVMWAALATVSLMLVMYVGDDLRLVLISLAFGALFSVSGRFLMSRAKDARPWAAMSVGVSLAWFLFVYLRVGENPPFDGVSYLWSWVALAFALGALRAVSVLLDHVPGDHPHKQVLLGLFVFSGASFAALALIVALPGYLLPLALSCLLAILGYVNTRVPLMFTPHIMSLLGAGAFICLYGEVAPLAHDAYDNIYMWPSLVLALPGLLIGAGAWTLSKDAQKVRTFLGALFLFFVTFAAYVVVRKWYHGFPFGGARVLDDMQQALGGSPVFLERAFLNQIFFVFALLAFWVHRTWGDAGARKAGDILMILAFVRLGYNDFLGDFPLFPYTASQSVGGLPVFNGLLLTYGAPVLWCVCALRLLPDTLSHTWVRFYKVSALFLTFVWVTLCVRQLFHGANISWIYSGASDGEIYTYSAVWIALSLVYLLLGMVKKDQGIRVASLPVMLLSIVKVFFYDAGSLTGLTRALSFLVLGLVLLGLSWFYTRFVFTKTPDPQH